MPPRNVEYLPTSEETELNEVEAVVQAPPEAKRPPMVIVWTNVAWMSYIHLAGLYGLYLFFYCEYKTWAFTFLWYFLNAFGITAGAHRLWSHRSYKAKLPFRTFLMLCNSIAFQNDIIEWSRDHRVHHKYSETEADPHNAKRGFFFAHCGWLLCRKHPDVKAKGKQIDMSDLHADPVCAFQRKYYFPLVITCSFILPTVLPWYFWGESLWNAFFVCGWFRLVFALNITWFVNSAAHMWGNKPYDRHINPAENFFVTFGAIGEGFHNYHHTFPMDYNTSEFGWHVNATSLVIDFMALIGQVYDRKTMSHEAVFGRKKRTGDGSSGFGVMEPPKSD
ncbi:hypothetical protein CAPTEDRAFT_158126 [Capitella teleta]|uniref:Fatty acid desaturase domain-containing protein n=1 Tax=Capitella teleta TaxID=283909 RepID=R7TL57_CAPTE|nr:hypothetical protein CAPTEDRAFT_158126 [Capitella teleta]|eukprot:ELT92286.1 hypothetical protein CAPTEDRAFT_158126 [Capitella teleta]